MLYVCLEMRFWPSLGFQMFCCENKSYLTGLLTLWFIITGLMHWIWGASYADTGPGGRLTRHNCRHDFWVCL